MNLAQIHAGFQQVRGIGMSQRMNRGVFADAGVFERRPEGGLDSGMRGRFGGLAFMSQECHNNIHSGTYDGQKLT